MKKMSKSFTLIVVAVMVMIITTTASVSAAETFTTNALSEVEQLKADIAEIESLVDRDNFQKFYRQNKEWIEDVNARLEKYMADIPKDQREIALKELRGENPYRTNAVSDDFYSHEFHLRGGYWTYSLHPKMSVRLWRPSCQAGWDALSTIYSSIAQSSPGSSLHDQYWCHFDLVFAGIWDIERGREDVSYSMTLRSLCNYPEGYID